MMNRRIARVFVICFLALSALAGAGGSQIVPGQGTSEVKLGQARKQVEASLGKPQDVDRNEFNPHDTYSLYYNRGIEVTYTDDKVSMITLHPADGQWKAYPGATREGVTVASTAADVKKRMGAATEQGGSLTYPALGVFIRVRTDGRIEYISLRAPGSR